MKQDGDTDRALIRSELAAADARLLLLHRLREKMLFKLTLTKTSLMVDNDRALIRTEMETESLAREAAEAAIQAELTGLKDGSSDRHVRSGY
jgi:hypothetical protein